MYDDVLGGDIQHELAQHAQIDAHRHSPPQITWRCSTSLSLVSTLYSETLLGRQTSQVRLADEGNSKLTYMPIPEVPRRLSSL